MKKNLKGIFIFLIITSCFLSVLVIVGAFVLYKFSKEEISDEVIRSVRTSSETQFYRFDRTKSEGIKSEPILMDNVCPGGGSSVCFVTYDKIPSKLINAFIAIEDKRFLEHNGIDYIRSSAAILNYVFRGRECFGGSTISQQVVKNLTGNNSITVKRKLSEAFATLHLESKYDKTEILELYLNIINLANGCFGISDAANLYFSKCVDELDLLESVTIAAITNNPSRYNPIKNPEENKKRRDLILHCMLEQGFISEEEYDNNVSRDVVLALSTSKGSTVSSWYIDTVISDVIGDLSAKYDITPQEASILIYRGGYKIYTAIDIDIQGIVELTFNNLNNFPQDSSGERPEASIIIIDPYSGDVLGIAGGIGVKQGSRLFNYATDSKRPSGSVIKPLSVYAPAIEKGIIEWSTLIEDSPLRAASGNGAPWPQNANRQYVGNVTVDYALSNSLNTVPVKILKELGNEYSFNILKNSLRINSLDTKRDIGDASLALGQHSVGVSLRELVSAYTIFSDGIMKKSRTYYKVTDKDGRVILDNQAIEERVISEESAAIMTKLMQNVITKGTASSLITLSEICEVAGKTGTTQYDFDKYFIGYTPILLAGVWYGFSTPKPLDYLGCNYSALLWNSIMTDIYDAKFQDQEIHSFKIPNSVHRLTFDAKTGLPCSESEHTDTIGEGWYNVKRSKYKK